ncbi:MAG: hypothetical protein JNK29_15965 [Anaerolineales bacterium]|nr:hypothetical protein [Anaerolineales bacterium]
MPDTFPPDAAHRSCGLCAELNDEEYALQKYGWEKDNTYLPAAAGRLTLVKDLRPHSGRTLHLQRCPQCGTYYLYRTDYEFLVNGSEDEEFLSRLTDAQAAEYLRPAG